MLLRLAALSQGLTPLLCALVHDVLDHPAAAAHLLAALGALGQEPVGEGAREARVAAQGARGEEHVDGVGDGDVLPLRVGAQLGADEDGGGHLADEGQGVAVPVDAVPF